MRDLKRDLEIVFEPFIKGTHFVGVNGLMVKGNVYTFGLDLLGIQPSKVIKEVREYLKYICKYDVKSVSIDGSASQRNLKLCIVLG